ncbi:MAG: AsmA family protein [Methylocella sp.]
MAEMATIDPASSPPPRKRVAGLLGILAFGVILAGMAAAAAPWLFSTNVLRREILAQIRQTTGLVAISQGHGVFVVLPQPHISIEDIRLAEPSGALRIDAKYLKGYLRVASLLRGRLEIASATLGEPQIAVDLDGRPMPPDSAIGRAAQAKSSSPQADVADEARLGVVSLIDGSARLTSRIGHMDVLLDAINVTVDWRKLGSAAGVAGTMRFRGQSADIAAIVERPTELLRGEPSSLNLKINGPALSLSAEGTLASAPGARFVGRFVAAAPSLRKLVETGGYFVELPAPFEDFALNSDANISADSASFSNLHLQLDGNNYEGALAVIMGEKRPVLSGTLAADSLSLRPFIANRTPALGRDGQWSHDSFDLDWEGFADVDLRVSAAHLTLPGVDLDDAAFSVMNQNDRLDIALIEAKAYSGALKGRATFAKTDSGVEMRASATASKVDVAALWPYSIESWRVAGAMSGSGNVESAGASMSELMRNLNGRVQVSLERGALGGVNLDQALRWIDKKPLGVADDIRYGGTGFDRVSFGLRIARGVAEIEDGATMQSHSLDLEFGGSIDFGERALNVHATAVRLGGEPEPGRTPAKFDFDVAGSWDDIALIPDAGSLIRQSGAAAPLLSPNRLDVKAAPAAEGH